MMQRMRLPQAPVPQQNPLVGMYNMPAMVNVPQRQHQQGFAPLPLNLRPPAMRHPYNGLPIGARPMGGMVRQHRLPLHHKRPSTNQLPPSVLAQMQQQNFQRTSSPSPSASPSPRGSVLKGNQLPSNVKVGGKPKPLPIGNMRPAGSGPFVRPSPPIKTKASNASNKATAARLLANGGFPELNVTVSSVKKSQPELEEEIDDDEEEALDDVEPDDLMTHAENRAPAPHHHQKARKTQQQSLLKKRRMQLQMQFVRRPDGKGFMRKNGKAAKSESSASSRGHGNSVAILKAAEAAVAKAKKKKKRVFRGANYRFDGTTIKKKKAPGIKGTSVNSNELTITVKEVPKTRSVRNSEIEAMINAAKPKEEGDMLSYLGIQRKDSSSDEQPPAPKVSPVSQKAKKSFRPSSTSPPGLVSSR